MYVCVCVCVCVWGGGGGGGQRDPESWEQGVDIQEIFIPNILVVISECFHLNCPSQPQVFQRVLAT